MDNTILLNDYYPKQEKAQRKEKPNWESLSVSEEGWLAGGCEEAAL